MNFIVVYYMRFNNIDRRYKIGFSLIYAIGMAIVFYHSWYPIEVKIHLKPYQYEEKTQLFYGNIRGFHEKNSSRQYHLTKGGFIEIQMKTPSIPIRSLRMDPVYKSDTVEINHLKILSGHQSFKWTGSEILKEQNIIFKGVRNHYIAGEGVLYLVADKTQDMQLLFHPSLISSVRSFDYKRLVFRLFAFHILLLIFYGGYHYRKKIRKRMDQINRYLVSISGGDPVLFSKAYRLYVLPGMIVIGILLLYYYICVYTYAVNIPSWDEYDAAFGILAHFHDFAFPENVSVLFKHHNEHRIFSYHLLMLVQYKLFGVLNFKYIILFAQMFMAVLLVLLFSLMPAIRLRWLAFLPVAFLLLVTLADNIDWGIVSIHSLFQSMLVLSALMFVARDDPWAFPLAILASGLATFSFGNGMFVWVIGFIMLIIRDKKPVNKIICWSASSIIFIYLYFSGIKKDENQGTLLEFIERPLDALLFFMTFFSNPFKYVVGYRWELLISIGFLVVTSGLYLLWKVRREFYEHSVVIGFMIYLLMSAGAATISRFTSGISSSIPDRYALLPVLFICSVYILTIRLKSSINIFALLGLIMMSFWIYMVRIHHEKIKLVNNNEFLKEGIVSYINDPSKSELPYPDPEKASSNMKMALDRGYYSLPNTKSLHLDKGMSVINMTELNSTNSIIEQTAIIDLGHFIKINGWAFSERIKRQNQIKFLLLCSEEIQYAIKMNVLPRQDIKGYFKSLEKDLPVYCGFSVFLDKSDVRITMGSYQAGIGIMDEKGIIDYKMLNQYIEFQ